MDDEALLNRIGEQDEEAFRLLYTRHSPPVYGLLCRLAGREDASDLLHETWLRAVRHRPLFRGQCVFCTWLTGIALNCYRDWRRRHVRGTSHGVTEARPALPRTADDNEMTAVPQILAALPPEHREVIVLHDIEGFTHDEIAAALEIDAATSRARLGRARRGFRQRSARGAPMNDDPLWAEEAAQLSGARVPIAPPADEQERLVSGLRERGLVRSRRRAAALLWAAAAAGGVIVVAGVRACAAA